MDLEKLILEDKKNGIPDKVIGNRYGVNSRYIERVITAGTGVNISNIIDNKQINKLLPKNFKPEKNTVWSFKSRGNWATHNGNYRGNWSPYIPRNVILRYSEENDLVLDYFCGAGTTAIECKLLNRNFIGLDINPYAIQLAKQNINFDNFEDLYSPEINFVVGDARELSSVETNSIDLICAHPPYADIINYTIDNPEDLSQLKYDKFLSEIEKVANESYRVLKDGKNCAILIGDMRKNKMIIPLGFSVIDKYLSAGFLLKELIIKRQHNCKTTGFWYSKSIKYNFFLLAHEYLAIFQKKSEVNNRINDSSINYNSHHIDDSLIDYNLLELKHNPNLETTTVWIFDQRNWLDNTISNLINRYSSNTCQKISIGKINPAVKKDLILITFHEWFTNKTTDIVEGLNENGTLGIICEDLRPDNDLIYSEALYLDKNLRGNNSIKLKEIIIISIENQSNKTIEANLNITHKFLLIYKKT